MIRVTVTLDDDIVRELRRIQGMYISDTGEEWSFTTIINIVLLSGLLGFNRLRKKDRKLIYDFIELQKGNLDLEAGVDTLASHTLDIKGWGELVHQITGEEEEEEEEEEKEEEEKEEEEEEEDGY